VIEGPDAIEAALTCGSPLDELYVDFDALDGRGRDLVDAARRVGTGVFGVTGSQLARVADAGTPQPLLAVAPLLDTSLERIPSTGIIVVAHDVRDPGNVGTIIRSADAAGASGVIVSGSAVDVFNPKVVRATAGSLFQLPIAIASSLEDVAAVLRQHGGRLLASVVRGGLSYRQLQPTGLTAIVMGNEARGLSSDDVSLCDESVSIEMPGRAESLNVSIAAALLVFAACEAHRNVEMRGTSRNIGEHERDI
jgi:TrmH family RNA methyltransferase